MKAAIEAVANNKMNGTETWKKFGKGKAGRNTKLTPVEEKLLFLYGQILLTFVSFPHESICLGHSLQR